MMTAGWNQMILSGALICLCAGLGVMMNDGDLQQTPPASAPAQQQQTPGGAIAGDWEGVLDVGAAKLRLVLHIAQQPNGSLQAKVDSPDQGATGLAVDAITFEAGVVRFEMKALQVVYEGKLSESGAEIAGKFTQAGASFPLTLKRGMTVAKRPQTPKPPFPYRAEDVSYENKAAGIRLAGTLTIPPGNGPHPAVILISGSGPQDRDETLFEHKPFLVLADHLTRKGIAVLRVDDRGVGKSTGSFATATSEDFTGDVLAGVEYLKTRSEVDKRKIGLIGHSEGGSIAPAAAAKSSDIAFIVMLAGTGMPGDEILYLQAEMLNRAAGASAEVIARNREVQERSFAIIKKEKDPAEAEKQLRAAYRELVKGDLPQQLEAEIKRINSPWFRYFINHDPRTTLKQVKVPVLALFGERDLQVAPKENLAAVKAALEEGGNKRFRAEILPGLNHLFQTAKTGLVTEYGQIEETMAPAALELISGWILETVK